jgi:hypothetical protein
MTSTGEIAHTLFAGRRRRDLTFKDDAAQRRYLIITP